MLCLIRWPINCNSKRGLMSKFSNRFFGTAVFVFAVILNTLCVSFVSFLYEYLMCQMHTLITYSFVTQIAHFTA